VDGRAVLGGYRRNRTHPSVRSEAFLEHRVPAQLVPFPLLDPLKPRPATVAGMMRMLVLYPQPIDEAAFDRHYHERHVPLAKSLPGVVSYTASRNARRLRGEASYYLIAEVDWQDQESLLRDFSSPLGKELAEDVDALEVLCPGLQSTIFEVDKL
jgi:uncharacterized protein (TIGR02118 family)